MKKLRSSLTFSQTQQYPYHHEQITQQFILGSKFRSRLSTALSLSQPQCPHHIIPTFICRNQNCLKNNEFLGCSFQCMDIHFDHPNDLIGYEIFKNSLQILQKQQNSLYLERSIKVRETINKLLHLRETICKYIDAQIQKSREELQKNQKNSPITDSKIEIQEIKQCILKIQQYRRADQVIVYNIDEQERQIYENINRRLRRMLNKIRNVLDVNGQINQFEENEDENQSEWMGSKRRQKNYEYKIEGNIEKVKNLIHSTPPNINRLKIYLNQDTFGEQFFYTIVSQSEELQKYLCSTPSSYQINKLDKESLPGCVVPVGVFRDNFFHQEGKLELIKINRSHMPHIENFVVEEKLKNIIHKI